MGLLRTYLYRFQKIVFLIGLRLDQNHCYSMGPLLLILSIFPNYLPAQSNVAPRALQPTEYQVWREQELKDYLRWYIKSGEQQIKIINEQQHQIRIETFDIVLFEQLSLHLKDYQLANNNKKTSKTYIKNITLSKDGYPQRPAMITLTLAGAELEMYYFYAPQDREYVLDFWFTTEKKPIVAIDQTADLQETHQKIYKNKNTEDLVKDKVADAEKIEESLKLRLSSNEKKIIPGKILENNKRLDLLKDFRYGLPYIWKYNFSIESLRPLVQLETTTPEEIFSAQYRESGQKHQDQLIKLSLSFYHQKKYGHLKKTIDLYRQFKKGKEDLKNSEVEQLFSYLEANVLLESYHKTNDEQFLSSGILKLEDLIYSSAYGDLVKVCFQFALTYYGRIKKYQKILELAKSYYGKSSEAKDRKSQYEAIIYILYSQSMLAQEKEIESFNDHPIVKNLIDTQEALVYKYYVYYSKNSYQELVKDFELRKGGLVKPFNLAMMHLVAESYFQIGELEKAKEIFESIIFSKKSYYQISLVRNRYALVIDLLNFPEKDIANAYESALDFSSDPIMSIEAKFRMFGFKYLRLQGKEDLIYLINLSKAEIGILTEDLKRSLWILRLRSLIVSKKYEMAYQYYQEIPWQQMPLDYQYTLKIDVMENLSGILKKYSDENDNEKIVKIWTESLDLFGEELLQERESVALVIKAYTKMGLIKNAKDLYSVYKKSKISYPDWVVDSMEGENVDIDVLNMQLALNESRFDDARALVDSLPKDHYLIHLLKIKEMEKLGSKVDLNIYLENLFIDEKKISAIPISDVDKLLLAYVSSLSERYTGERLRQRYLIVSKISSKIPMSYNSSLETSLILNLESMVEDGVDKKEVLQAWEEYKIKFPTSVRRYRLQYAIARYLINQKDYIFAKNFLDPIVVEKDVPVSIREMASVELRGLEKIKQ